MRMNLLGWSASLGMLACAVSACGDSEMATEEATAQREDAVRNGAVVVPWATNSTAPKYTKAIVNINGCSGTIIDPEWVLSATHCGFSAGITVRNIRPTGDVTRVVDRVVKHPSIDAVMLHLKSPFLDVPRVTLYAGTPESIYEKTVSIYGYGAKATGDFCNSDADCEQGEYCRTDGHVCLTPSSELRTGAMKAVDHGVAGYFRTLTNASGQLGLPGDSGGPAFLSGTLAGINSAWFFDLSGGAQVSVPAVRDWVLGVMVHEKTLWSGAYSDANGWDKSASHYKTLSYPDLNHDGRADVCGRGQDGIWCALSSGSSFANATLWASGFADAFGWTNASQYSTLGFPDLNKDGRADVCGRGPEGIWCALSNGTSFGTPTLWNGAYSNANGWNGVDHYSTIEYPDINGDGRADLCGRGGDGVWCAVSNGSAFVETARWDVAFSDANGWSASRHYETLHYPDVNGDGRADLCGRGADGMWCALSNEHAFGSPSRWSTSFTDDEGWGISAYFSTMAYPDVNGDARADVCGRGKDGIVCALSNGAAFGSTKVYNSAFSDANGWNVHKHFSTLSYPDLDHDGFADVCGRGMDGIWCAFSTGSSFGNLRRWSTDESDANQFDEQRYYTTIRFADVDGDKMPELCVRGGAGIYCDR